MGNCVQSENRKHMNSCPIKPEVNKIKIRCVKLLGGQTKREYTIENTKKERVDEVYDIIQREMRLARYKLVSKMEAAFIDEYKNNELTIVYDGGMLYHNRVYTIFVFKIERELFSFQNKHEKKRKNLPFTLTSGGVINEDIEQEENCSVRI